MYKRLLKHLIQRWGYDVVPLKQSPPFPVDFDPDAVDTIRAVKPYTMTSHERIYAVIQATRYIVAAKIGGAIVECGVWRGGSMMAVARTLLHLGTINVDMFLFDTYEGMTQPSSDDVDYRGVDAEPEFVRTRTGADESDWCRATIAEVENNLTGTSYPRERIKLIKGKVEETIPAQAPDRIALLRLDTDWYESTHHELVHLYPRLSSGGVLIIDDYGHWKGCRKATDAYFASGSVAPILFNRIDYTGRIGVKK